MCNEVCTILKVQCRRTCDLGSFLWALQRRTNKIPHRSKYLTVLQSCTLACIVQQLLFSCATSCTPWQCVSSYTQSRVFPHLLLIAYCISFPPLPSPPLPFLLSLLPATIKCSSPYPPFTVHGPIQSPTAPTS